ncbi:hypothetical protein AAEO50_13705 [Rossellomorea oryzaecorticis]|uniref:Uncharacterized protein n=1 Tax=Rossellomorea oryzaecorticis TaxID=1396505 RepID=A0ABU9KEN4_9BACI
MRCLCEQKETFDLKIEGDVGADPIWCAQCGCNLELEGLPISNELKEKLMDWVTNYGKWIDWDTDKITPNGIEMEEAHNREGEILTKQTKQELKNNYRMTFSPSTMGRSYASRNF